MKSRHLLLLFSLLFFSNLKAQNPTNKWVAEIGTAFAGYTKPDGVAVGGQIAYQTPRFTLARYFKSNFTMVGSFATAIGDNQEYTTFDGLLRYDFGNSYDKIVPYIVLGGSFIQAKRFTPTLNFGAGNTFWISSKYGINVQLLYKFSENRFESQKSHIYPSAGLVYSFGARSTSARLWDTSH